MSTATEIIKNLALFYEYEYCNDDGDIRIASCNTNICETQLISIKTKGCIKYHVRINYGSSSCVAYCLYNAVNGFELNVYDMVIGVIFESLGKIDIHQDFKYSGENELTYAYDDEYNDIVRKYLFVLDLLYLTSGNLLTNGIKHGVSNGHFDKIREILEEKLE